MAELDSYRATMEASITVGTGSLTLEIPVTADIDYASPDRSQGGPRPSTLASSRPR